MYDLVQLRDGVVAPAMQIDAKLISSHPAYTDDNEMAYMILVSTWYAMWTDLHPYLGEDFRKRATGGLIATVKFYNDCAQTLLSEAPRDILSAEVRFIGQALGLTNYLGDCQYRSLLQALRFGKRFCPKHADKIVDESYDKFYSVQDHLRDTVDLYAPPSLPELWLMDTIAEIVPWKKLCENIKSYRLEDSRYEMRYSSGASYSTHRDLYSKVKEARKYDANMFPPILSRARFTDEIERAMSEPFSVLEKGSRDSCFDEISDHYTDDEVIETVVSGVLKPDHRLQQNVVKLMDVPKSYKSRRMIAPENALRQARATRVGNLIADELPDYANNRDQSRNQRYAHMGAKFGNLATIDLSAASDSISRRLFRLFPNLFIVEIKHLLPTHFVDSRKKPKREGRQVLYSLATMGNGITFPLETWVFAAIGKLAVTLAAKYQGWYDEVLESGLLEGKVNHLLSVYGDDIIIDVRAVATLLDLLELFGFTVNQDKSYTADYICPLKLNENLRFRESCGKDFLTTVTTDANGTVIRHTTEEVTSVYWPKHELDSEHLVWDSFKNQYVDHISSLVAMHNGLWYQNRQLWVRSIKTLEQWVYKYEPDMTKSPEEDNPDLRGDSIFFDTLGNLPIGHSGVDNNLISTCPQTSSMPVEVLLRNYVLYPSMRYDAKKLKELLGPENGERRKFASDLYQRYKYWYFLQYGPTYTNKLDEVLGISERPLEFSQFVDCQKMVWKQTLR